MLHSLFILFAVVRGQFEFFEDCFDCVFEDCFDEIKCSEDLEFIIPNQKCLIRMSKNQLR